MSTSWKNASSVQSTSFAQNAKEFTELKTSGLMSASDQSLKGRSSANFVKRASTQQRSQDGGSM